MAENSKQGNKNALKGDGANQEADGLSASSKLAPNTKDPSKHVLDKLEFLSTYLPASIRNPLMWIAATLLAVQIISKIARPAVGEAQRTYTEILANPAGASAIAFILFIVLVAGLADARSKNKLKAAENDHYKKAIDRIPSIPNQPSPDDEDLLAQDSIIVKSIQTEERQKYPQRRKTTFESRIIAVVSGKGGVGKSLLSLGLLEDFSRDEKALLVDFDLHNRGLTSLLSDSFHNEEHDYVIDLLKSFLDENELAELLKAYSLQQDKKEDSLVLTEKFRRLNLKFSGVEPEKKECQVKVLGMDSIPKASPKLLSPLKAHNGFFLPSIPPGGSFLGSRKVRDASEDAAFLFFKALSYRVRNQNGIQNIIIDCHGAHDLYTVGLIRAATDLVIVTTPDMGSLDGTRELIQFGQQVTGAGGNNLPRSVLVVNRCIDDDANARELEKKWRGALTGGVVRIARNDSVERIARNYRFGSVAAQPIFWNHIEEISQCLRDS